MGDVPRPLSVDPDAPFWRAAARVTSGADPHEEATALVAEMTLDERLGCLDGDTPFWPGLIDMTRGGYARHPWPAARVERLGVPGIEFADGPRGCVVGNATAFPVSMARGASFDPDLERRIGEAIGAELRASGATLTGAVCTNLLHHPAWGRAQETYGEDPHHVGEMAVALTEGLQRHVMASVKHFALNSIENARFDVDVHVDERTLHEVYLPHFRKVAAAGVASVMSAYNAVNGEWCGQHRHLLTEILREEWGWDGIVISDFVFGVRDAAASVRAGLDIEMPFRHRRAMSLRDDLEATRVTSGEIEAAAVRVVSTLLRFADLVRRAPDRDVIAGDDHRRLALDAAISSTVMLRNESSPTTGAPLLPFDPDRVRRVATLGRLAARPNLGDGGSSDVHPPFVVTPIDGLRAGLPGIEVFRADEDLGLAATADVVVVFVGLTKDDEGEFLDPAGTARLAEELFPPTDHPELGVDAPSPFAGSAPGSPADASVAPMVAGGDRRTLRLSPMHENLIAAAGAVNPNVVVVVQSGSAVTMRWLDDVRAVLMTWYPGMEGGHALAEVLSGRAAPGGRLPFAVPADETDLPPFDPDAREVTYGPLHGQWWLDAHDVPARFPFGFGLTYAEHVIGEARYEGVAVERTDRARIACRVTDVTGVDGDAVVQVYGSVPGSRFSRPRRRLVGFRKVRVPAGTTVGIDVAIDLSVLDVRVDGAWLTEELPVRLEVGRFAGDPGARVVTVEPRER